MNNPSWKTRTLLTGAALLALAAVPLARADYQSTVLSQGPVGYWRLNETTQPQNIPGAANLGSLGSSALGTYESFPARGLTGPFAGSSAVGFDGGAQAVSTPWQAGLNPNAFSVELWANPAIVPHFAYVASSVEVTAPRSGWYLAQDDGSTFGLGSAFVVRMFYQNGANPAVTLSAPVSLPVGSWYHLVLTYDGSTASLYVNGVLAQSGTALGYVGNVDAPFTLGKRSSNNFFWPGQAAEVAMYNGALSAAQVSNHYTTATTTPANYASTVQADAPLLFWRFKEAADPPAANLGTLGSAGDGLYIYDARAGVTGPTPATFPGFDAANKAAAFDAGGGVVRVPPLNLNTNTVTISGWINATGLQSTATGLIICHSGTTDAGLTIDQVSGGLGLGYIWDGNNYGWSPSGDSFLPGLPDSDWAYVALVIQPSQAAIYICDGNNFFNFTSVTNSFNVTHANQAFEGATLFGAEAGSTTRNFNGAIDEVAIFDRALASGELYSQYASAVGGLSPRIFADLQGPTDSVIIGDPIVLTVDAGGTPPLTYTWHRGGTTVATTPNGVLTIPSSTAQDAGNYDVTISNGSGSAPSQQVTVTVVTPTAPSIVSSLGFQDRALYPGGTVSMSVVASGGGLKYQWFKDSAPIASATGSAFRIASVASSDAGGYSVSITNTLGTASNGPPVAISILTPASGSYEALVVTSAPEAWWRLGERAGSTTLRDGMGRHDGYYTNLNGTVPPVTLGVPGALSSDPDTAASFAPANQGLGLIPYAASLNPGQFTVEGWVKTTVTGGSLVPFSDNDNNSGGWWVETIAGWWNGNCSAGYFGNNGNVNTAAQIVPGEWSHVVLTYDATRVISGTHYPFVLFVNGQTDGFVWGGPPNLNTGSPFIIGGHTAANVVDKLFDGQVDEVAFYGRILSQTEIQNHFQGRFGSTTAPYFIGAFIPQTVTTGKSISFSTVVQGSAPITMQWYKNNSPVSGATSSTLTIASTALSDTGTYTLWATNVAGVNSQSVSVNVISPVGYANVTNGLVLHLRFDVDATDSSGRGNNGTPVDSPGFVPGVIGAQALQYTTETVTNGTVVSFVSSSYVDLGTPSDLQFGAGSSFSVSLWVKMPVGDLEGDLPFIGNATNSNNNLGWDLSPSYQRGGWQWTLDDGPNVINVNGPDGSINDGVWHNFVLTVDRTAHVANTYLDGINVAVRDITSLGSIDTGGPLTIGQDPTGTYPEAGSVALDDVGVWRRALTPLEVAEIQSAGGTAGRSFDTVPTTIVLTLTRSGSSITLSWPAGTLLQSDTLGTSASWTPVPGASAPSYTFTPGAGNKFFRVLQ